MTQDTHPIPLPAREIVISQALIDSYASLSGDFNTVHVDDAAGRDAGFGGTIAHGCIPLESVFASIQAWLGTEALPEGSVLRLRYRAPSRPGDRIHADARLIRRAEDGSSATIEFACRNQQGTVVIEGDCELQRLEGAR